MTIRTITGTIEYANGDIPANSRAEFYLNGIHINEVTIAHSAVSVHLDASGDITVDLYPNDTGYGADRYNVDLVTYSDSEYIKEIRRVNLGKIYVEDVDGQILQDLLAMFSGPSEPLTVAQEASADAIAAANAAAASAANAALYDGPWLDTVSALIADTSLTYTAAQPGTVTAGDYVRTRAEGFAYQVAASGASGHHVTTAGGVRLDRVSAPAVPALASGIVPWFHFRACAVTATPKVVIVGDSISTDAPTVTHDETESMWGHIQRAFRECNPHLAPIFVNMAWGGATWTTAYNTVADEIAGGKSPPDWGYGDGSKKWIEYVEDQSPDLVIFAFGMNDRQNFVTAQARAVINDTRTWTNVPDLLMVTPMVPNRLSSDVDMSSADSQEGRYFVAHWERTWALYNRVGLIDLNRQYARTVHGIDPRATSMLPDGAATSRTLPYTFPNQCDHDFGIEIAGASTLWPVGFKLPLSRTGVNSSSELWITGSGGFVRAQFITILSGGVPSEQIDIVSAVAVPAGDFTLKVFVKDAVASIKLDGVTVYEGQIIRHGGRFTPSVAMMDDSTPTATIRTFTGRYVKNTPALSDPEMWGDDATTNSEAGGNDKNHPTSVGAAYVYRTLMDAQDWSIPALSFGATAYPSTMGRNIGVGTAAPMGRLHITKRPTAGGASPAVTANNFVLEDETGSGMTILVGDAGAGRISFGTAADNDAGGFVFAAATGNTSLRAGGATAATFIGAPGNNFTAMQLLSNVGGTTSIKPVQIGAADSAGTGFRTLRIQN